MSDTSQDLTRDDSPSPEHVPEESISGVRRRRSELKAAMVGLEQAIATGWDDAGEWIGPVTDRLDALATAFRNHVTIHEGADSFHAEVLRAQPHLASKVSALQRDHRRIEQALTGLVAAVAEPLSEQTVVDVRGRAGDLLHRLASHRRHGADLVWQAFNADLGGEH